MVAAVIVVAAAVVSEKNDYQKLGEKSPKKLTVNTLLT